MKIVIKTNFPRSNKDIINGHIKNKIFNIEDKLNLILKLKEEYNNIFYIKDIKVINGIILDGILYGDLIITLKFLFSNSKNFLKVKELITKSIIKVFSGKQNFNNLVSLYKKENQNKKEIEEYNGSAFILGYYYNGLKSYNKDCIIKLINNKNLINKLSVYNKKEIKKIENKIFNIKSIDELKKDFSKTINTTFLSYKSIKNDYNFYTLNKINELILCFVNKFEKNFNIKGKAYLIGNKELKINKGKFEFIKKVKHIIPKTYFNLKKFVLNSSTTTKIINEYYNEIKKEVSKKEFEIIKNYVDTLRKEITEFYFRIKPIYNQVLKENKNKIDDLRKIENNIINDNLVNAIRTKKAKKISSLSGFSESKKNLNNLKRKYIKEIKNNIVIKNKQVKSIEELKKIGIKIAYNIIKETKSNKKELAKKIIENNEKIYKEIENLLLNEDKRNNDFNKEKINKNYKENVILIINKLKNKFKNKQTIRLNTFIKYLFTFIKENNFLNKQFSLIFLFKNNGKRIAYNIRKLFNIIIDKIKSYSKKVFGIVKNVFHNIHNIIGNNNNNTKKNNIIGIICKSFISFSICLKEYKNTSLNIKNKFNKIKSKHIISKENIIYYIKNVKIKKNKNNKKIIDYCILSLNNIKLNT